MNGPLGDLVGLEAAVQSAIAALAASSRHRVTRVVTLARAGSTQDEALRLVGEARAGANAAGDGGLLVVAARQTGGRGRLGRAWADTGDAGLAATFVVDSALPAARVSIAAGVAACEACAAAMGATGPTLGIRWPNDVVEVSASGPGRKVSGVLVERRDGATLVGVGVNVSQGADDWAAALAGRAVSLRQLGSRADRSEVCAGLAVAMARWLDAPDAVLRGAWLERNVLLGRRCEFEHAGARVCGVVESIDPANAIVVRTERGDAVTLPAEGTTLVHGRA